MATSHAGRTARIARFGVFEVNLAAGELRKNGARIGLQEQPFQLLVLLLERAPDVISREEITSMMAGGEELEVLSHELAEFARTDAAAGAVLAEAAHEFEEEAEGLHDGHHNHSPSS